MKTNGSKSEEIRASAKYIHMFIHKARKVINQISGRLYEQALMLLEFMIYQICHPIL
jgi:large subunit ribosomal protein L22